MIKKTILLSAIIAQLTISCSKDDSTAVATDNSLSAQITTILQTPYSALTPDQQKVKLENEANDFLLKMDKSKTSSAIEAIQNLENLISISSVDIQMEKNGNGLQDLLNVSGVYGIYTWKASQKIWIKTISTTELKFIFPAKKSLSTNNAVLSSSSIASNVKVDVIDTDEKGSWQYNQNTEEYSYVITDPAIYDQLFLPSSVNATLLIDGTEAGTYTANATYSGGKPEPTEAGFKFTLNDGYVWEINGKRTQPVSAKSSFTYNGSNLIDFNVGSTADIDKLIEGSELTQYLGKANGIITIMDNFVIVADINIEGMTNDENALETSLTYPNYYSSTYSADLNTYNKALSVGEVAAFNKNVKMALVSKKDGTKIADVFERSEKGESYYNYQGNLIQNYDNVLYLRFKDNTEVAMDVSDGFSTLETKFQDFIDAFNRP